MSFSGPMPASRCTGCGRATSGASNPVGDEGPGPGDITLCLYCGHIMAFAPDLTLRDLTPDEMHAVAGDPLVLRMQAARGLAMKDVP